MALLPFNFNVALVTLNHLGRQLYRTFNTVLGEAISNAWDADANNVWIYIDQEQNKIIIKDDGQGMSEDDFRHKFLYVGYEKRGDNNENTKSPRGRPYIGRKGIGKLALLAGAERIHVVSKTKDSDFIGVTIDNKKIDQEIKANKSIEDHTLDFVPESEYYLYSSGLEHGTIVIFDKLSTNHSEIYFRKVIALFLRFALKDPTFKIYINDREISYQQDLSSLIEHTQILWTINNPEDEFVFQLKENLKVANNYPGAIVELSSEHPITGFIASVDKPSNAKDPVLNERLGIDLFVNGRLRERDILRHIPKNRIYENYLYGQIHYDNLDDDIDRFTSSREGIMDNDPKFKAFLDNLNSIMSKIAEQWNKIRKDLIGIGDLDNKENGTKAQQLITGALYEKANEFVRANESMLCDDDRQKTLKKLIEDLAKQGEQNVSSYIDCFVSENVLRTYILQTHVDLSLHAITIDKQEIKVSDFIKDRCVAEQQQIDTSGINTVIRDGALKDLSFLDMTALAKIIDPKTANRIRASLTMKSDEYRPLRNAVMHTALLTEGAKSKLAILKSEMIYRLNSLALPKTSQMATDDQINLKLD